MAYKIKDWNKHFENSRSRRVETLHWIPVPNKHDGEGFRSIMQRPDGIVIYGCWHLILQVASKCHPRGTLVRADGSAMDAQAIALKTGAKESDIKKALEILSKSPISWVECHPSDTQVTPECHQGGNTSHHRTEHNRTEQPDKGGEGSRCPVTVATVPGPAMPGDPKSVKWDSEAMNWQGIDATHRAKWHEAYPAVDIDRELLGAAEWLKANPTKAVKRAWYRFLTNWFRRTQESGGTRQSRQDDSYAAQAERVKAALKREDEEKARRQAEEVFA
jgi:hypothetical protein